MTYKQKQRVFEMNGVIFDGESIDDVITSIRPTIHDMAVEHKARFTNDPTPVWKLEQKLLGMFRCGLVEVQG